LIVKSWSAPKPSLRIPNPEPRTPNPESPRDIIEACRSSPRPIRRSSARRSTR
jgi:hypothetical protein